MKKSSTTNKMLGWGELLAGAVLISPADETILTLITSGAGVGIAPVQLPATAVAGGIIVLDGLKRLGLLE